MSNYRYMLLVWWSALVSYLISSQVSEDWRFIIGMLIILLFVLGLLVFFILVLAEQIRDDLRSRRGR